MNATLWLVFARGLGFFARAPGFGRQNVPAVVRAGFAFALAACVAATLPRVVVRDGAMLLVAVAGEVITGVTLALGATIVAEAAAAGGRLLDDFVGLRASVPQIAVAPPGIGGLWSLTFAVAFFALGGADALLVAFAHTFSVVPAGAAADAAFFHHAGAAALVKFARLSLELAAPGICVALCVQGGLAILARVVPRFSHLSIAYPPACAAVLLAAFASLAALRELAER